MGEFLIVAGGTFTGALAAMLVFAVFMHWQARRQLALASQYTGRRVAVLRPCCPECRSEAPFHDVGCTLNPPCDICGPHNGAHSPACPNAPDYEAVHGHPPPIVPGDEWKDAMGGTIDPDHPSDWEKRHGA